MKCARVHLQERAKGRAKTELPSLTEKPRRYCQKRLVNPKHEEDPRWMDIWDRFHCNANCDQNDETPDSAPVPQDTEDLVLTVQTLQFQGGVDPIKRPRTSFKYKTISNGNKHRMFVKEIVAENEYNDEDRTSQLTCYYFDDYVKYLCGDRSRPASAKSSIFLKTVGCNVKESKATQVEFPQTDLNKKIQKVESKVNSLPKKCNKSETKEEIIDISETIKNTKIAYQKIGKRKSLTISRAQSPETVQVIRVDVVCNYPSSSILSNYEDNKNVECSSERSISKLEHINVKNNHFANKYLLAKSIKKLDENLGGGSKVTLLCKTFKLSNRLEKASDKSKHKKYSKAHNNTTKNDNRQKIRKY